MTTKDMRASITATDEIRNIATTMRLVNAVEIWEMDEEALRVLAALVRDSINGALFRAQKAGAIDEKEQIPGGPS